MGNVVGDVEHFLHHHAAFFQALLFLVQFSGIHRARDERKTCCGHQVSSLLTSTVKLLLRAICFRPNISLKILQETFLMRGLYVARLSGGTLPRSATSNRSFFYISVLAGFA